jgi:hypothetical protein
MILCLLVPLAAPIAAGARTNANVVMRLSPTTITVGNYNVRGAAQLPTYAGAIRAFGTPQVCTLHQSNWSRVRWTGLGLAAEFITYGVIPNGGDGCSAPAGVQLDNLVVSGSRWHTARGLHVGSTVLQLQRLYPKALPHGRRFWIVIGKNVIGTTSLYPIVSVTIRNGAVSSFIFQIGAEGD